MAGSRPRRVADGSPAEVVTEGRWRSIRRCLVDGALWTLGGLGLLSLLAAVAAHVWGFSIVLFSTGSMSPTIPAGSAALVRLVPAGELRTGDIATVERAGALPITHRITTIRTLDGSQSMRVITMRGDANDIDDPEPYVVHDARVVIASVPGVAGFVSGLRDWRLIGVLSVLAGALVTWAFWPRSARKAARVAAAVLVVASPLVSSTEANAAEVERQVIGRHIVLTVVEDPASTGAMAPDQPVYWQVGVDTRAEEEGALHIGLGLTADAVKAEAVSVEVLACSERWQAQACPGTTQTWHAGGRLDQAFLPPTYEQTRELGSTIAGTPVWVLIRATLSQPEQDVKATLKVAAWGGGEVVSAETGGGGGKGHGGLAFTGADGTLPTLALAGAAIGVGLLLAWLAGARRRGTDREVVQ